jgi:hypothetical protein
MGLVQSLPVGKRSARCISWQRRRPSGAQNFVPAHVGCCNAGEGEQRQLAHVGAVAAVQPPKAPMNNVQCHQLLPEWIKQAKPVSIPCA